MATPVSGQEYEPILAWTQLLTTLQRVTMEISNVIKYFFHLPNLFCQDC